MAELAFGSSTFGAAAGTPSTFGNHAEIDTSIFAQSTALIVDPTPMSRSILVSQIREFGFKGVYQSTKLSDALARFTNNETFDVLLLEHTFLNDRTCAVDLIDDLRAKQLLPYSTVVFIVTGESRYSKVAEAAESGFDAYILKPHRATQLHHRLQLSATRKRSLQEIFGAIAEQKYDWAADLCLERYSFRGPFWLYAARIGAELLMRCKRFGEAQELYEAIAEAKAMPWAKLGVARSQLESGQTTLSTTTLSALIDEEPSYADAYDVLARAQFDLGDVQRARSTYAMACKMTPDSITRTQNYGMMLFYAGDIDEARDFLDRAVRLGRDSKLFDCQSLVALGFCSLHSNDRKALQRCIQDFERLLANNIDSARHQRNVVVLRLQLMLYDNKSEAFLSALPELFAAIKEQGYEFEAAGNLVSLLSYAAKFQFKVDRPHVPILELAMRFCTSRSLTDILVGAAKEHPNYAELVKESAQKIQMVTQNCLSMAMRGDATNAVRQLLAEGENTRNAKLIESAVQLVARYRAKISDAPALEVRADSLRQKFCKSAANRAADFVSSQPARGAGQLALRA
jgi:Tfp pilus assembly protein PilF/CheY-like chemotaxis protein